MWVTFMGFLFCVFIFSEDSLDLIAKTKKKKGYKKVETYNDWNHFMKATVGRVPNVCTKN